MARIALALSIVAVLLGGSALALTIIDRADDGSSGRELKLSEQGCVFEEYWLIQQGYEVTDDALPPECRGK